MCLAMPGQVIDIDRTSVPVMGTVSFGGVRKQVCLEWVPDVAVGQYVIVHVGFAISAMDEEDAKATLQLFSELEGPRGEDRSAGQEREDPKRSSGSGK